MPIKSSYPDVSIPSVDTWTLLFKRSSLPFSADKILFHSTDGSGRSYTYSQLLWSALGFGNAIRETWNWQKGDVLAIYSPNDIDYPAVAFGCHWAGGVVTTANHGYTQQELAHQLRDSGAKAIATQAGNWKNAVGAAREVGIPEDRVILIGPDQASPKHFTRLDGFRIQQQPARPVSINPKEDLSFLVYSSGTTGKPKGVMLTHTNVVSNILMFDGTNEGFLTCGDGTTGSGDRTVGFLPMFHILGLISLVQVPIHAGHEVFVMPQFELRKFCSLVQKERITYNTCVPRIILALAKDPVAAEYDLSSLRFLQSAAAPLTRELVDALYQRLKIPVKQAYGLSETSPGCFTQAIVEWDKAIGSVGKPYPNVEAKIVDIDSGEEVSSGKQGELWVRGPNVFKGYLNNPAATAGSVTPDGWFKTGDVGYFDPNGFLFITDRIKELIKYNGFQVAPAELEGLLVSHPKVKDVAVIGVYSQERQTELPRAYIVANEGVPKSSKTAEELASWLHSKVAKHKWLRGGIRFVDAIPASTAGKILRRELKVLAEKEQSATRAKL